MTLSKLKKLVSKADKGTDLKARLNQYLEQRINKPIPYKQKPSHKPSGLGSKCYRKIYYDYWRVEKDVPYDARAARIFDTGNSYESMVVQWLRELGEHIPYRNKSNGQIPKSRHTGEPDPQFPIKSEEWRIRKGLIDNVAIVNGDLWLDEIKSSKASKFNKLLQPMSEHITQAGIYLKAFNELLAAGEYAHIPELANHTEAVGVRYIYVNKDTTELAVFEITKQQFEMPLRKLDAKITTLNNAIDQKKLPAKTPDYCAYCAFQHKCKRNWNDV